MLNHTALPRLGVLLLVSTLVPSSATQSGPPARRPPREPRITFLDQPPPQAREIIEWAVGRFRDTGLQLPDLEISFPAQCAGKLALYHIGQTSIEFCRISRRGALHELAHAWDDTSGAVDREAFLEMRGLSVWWGGTEMPATSQGSEHLAQIIAWGLMDDDARRTPHLPANSVTELTETFKMLTRG